MSIKPMKPEGLKPSPTKFTTPEKVDGVTFNYEKVPINDKVGWLNLIKEFVRQNLINDVLNLQKGVAMSSKAWYLSKTIWFNVLSAVWFLVGPMIGIPTLDPDTFATILAIGNFILRVITKGGVSIS